MLASLSSMASVPALEGQSKQGASLCRGTFPADKSRLLQPWPFLHAWTSQLVPWQTCKDADVLFVGSNSSSSRCRAVQIAMTLSTYCAHMHDMLLSGKQYAEPLVAEDHRWVLTEPHSSCTKGRRWDFRVLQFQAA